MKKFISIVIVSSLLMVTCVWAEEQVKPDNISNRVAMIGKQILGGFGCPFFYWYIMRTDSVEEQPYLSKLVKSKFLDRIILETGAIIFGGFSLCVFPIAIPYAVDFMAIPYEQNGAYWHALIGSLIGIGLSYSSQGKFEYVPAYCSSVIGSIITYNILGSFGHNKDSKNYPQIYLTRNSFDNQLMINAQLMRLRF